MVDHLGERIEVLLQAGQVESSDQTGVDNAWRLKFNRVPRPRMDDRPQRKIHDCFAVVLVSSTPTSSRNMQFTRSWHTTWIYGVNKTDPLNVFLQIRSSLKKNPRLLHCSGDGVAEYYQQQEEMLYGFTEMDTIADCGNLPGMSKEDREKVAKSERTAILLSNLANVVLFAAKIYASIRSGSLAIIASTLDSLLDLLSGFILWFTAYKMQKPNPYLYPIGKKRMQPLGILVFASVMATLGLQIVLESVRQLVSMKRGLLLEGDRWHWVVGIMVSVTIVKLLLVIYCRTFTNEIVKAYAQDHFFDVITNSIGLLAAVLASRFYWWIDPAGAIVLALYTIRTWSSTVLENVNSLVGKTASPDYLQKLTYLCWNHHKAIRHIDTVRAYTFGSHYFVEVDIVLPSDMPLQQAHDIGEALQEKLESLPDIERAFVHLDYEYTHRPEHGNGHS